MKLGCRCSVCGNYFFQEEDDLFMEFDFKELKITFICRNPKCKHENVMDVRGWKENQKHSPLPRISIC